MGILIVIVVFLLFAALIGVRSGHATGRRFVWPLPALPRIGLRRPEPVLLAQPGGALLVLGAMGAFAADVRPLGSALLAAGGGCFIYAGATVAGNKDGEADRLAERHWGSQNIFLKNPREQARRTGTGLAIFGGILMFVALATL